MKAVIRIRMPLMTAFICNHAYIGFNRRIHVQ